MNEPSQEKPPTNPETPSGTDGIGADGHTIPAHEMIEDRWHGANTDALERFQRQATPAALLLAQLSGASRVPKATRGLTMTRGDIAPGEWAKLQFMYHKLLAKIERKENFSVVALSLYALLKQLTDHAFVSTQDCRAGVIASHGFSPDADRAFDVAVAIVWSVAQGNEYRVVPDMFEEVEALIEELGLKEEEEKDSTD